MYTKLFIRIIITYTVTKITSKEQLEAECRFNAKKR